LVNKVANTGPEIQERGMVGPQPDKVRRQKPGADENQMTLF
ncbi:MAG: SOS response-associated peptidase, partial [Mesorhizobium sp.]